MNVDLPFGSWTHSFEEDEACIEVYRPTATFAFPPSRKGRQVLAFSSAAGQNSVTALMPGADDRPRAVPEATLRALGAGRYASGSGTVLEIVEATPSILRLARRQGGDAG